MPKRSSKDVAQIAHRILGEITEPAPKKSSTPAWDAVRDKKGKKMIRVEITDVPPRTPVQTDPLPDLNAAAAALGRRGGLKGGPARAKALSAKERSEIATRAAKSRWKKQKKTK